MIVLAYLWIMSLVPLLLEKDDVEIQWHAKHGLVLFAAEVISWIAFNIVAMALSMVTGGFGCLFGMFAPFLWLAILGLHIVCIVKGLQGQRFLVPGVSEYTSRF